MADKLADYEDAEQANKLIKLPCKVSDLKDTLISHNSIVAIWEPVTEDEDVRMWRGMFWQIPNEYMEKRVKKIMGLVAETIPESDTINILIEASVKRHEAALKERSDEQNT